MLKQLWGIIFFSLSLTYSIAQNRENIWELSYNPALDSLSYPACGINFNSGVADTFTTHRTMAFFSTDASICDTIGNLLFYTNGVFVANKNNDTLLNSVNFDTGWATSFYGSAGLGINQGAIIIPRPNNFNQYYIFYVNAEVINTSNDIQPLYISYSIVDMNLDGGLGGIIANKKNIHLIYDTLTLGRLIAVKHANGRDWWIISHRYNSDIYYKLLVTPDSIYGPYKQNIGSIIPLGSDGNGQAVFSPDGSKFVMLGTQFSLDYMNFDRCTGNFYDDQLINVVNDSSESVGCSFSPDGRFLYVSSLLTLWQYDTWSGDISSSAIKIGSYDNYTDDGIQVLFYTQTLGSDNKIYIATSNSSLHLHVINNPDSLGLACNFTQHSFVLPQWNIDIPSFPNYDLGALPGSPCDTLNGINQLSANDNQLSVYPNPAINQLNLIYSISKMGQVAIFDVLGRKLMELSVYPYNKSRIIYLNQLSPGMYELRLSIGNKELVKKFVKE